MNAPNPLATVELSFSALPAHVRTARLVAAAVARRSGVDEMVLDEVRLAVGEACSRAVDLHRRHCPVELVRVRLTDDADAFLVEVRDLAPVTQGSPDPLEALAAAAEIEEVDPDALSGVGLAVISGLVDDLRVEQGAGERGTAVVMAWPAGPATRR